MFLVYILVGIFLIIIISVFLLKLILSKKKIKIYYGIDSAGRVIYGHKGVDSLIHNNAGRNVHVIIKNSTNELDKKNFDYYNFLKSCNAE